MLYLVAVLLPPLAVLLCGFATVFAAGAAPGVEWLDAGELTAAGYTLGISHPPGQPGHALLLDCRSLACTLIPLPAGVKLVVANTMVKHQLASSEYNKRRADCEAAVEALFSGQAVER